MWLDKNHLESYNFYFAKKPIPAGWEIVSLQDVSYVVTDGTHKTPAYTSSGIRFISIKNIRPFQPINWDSYQKYISQEEHSELIKRCHPEFGDILFPRIGTLGFAKRIDFQEEVSIFVGLGLIKPIRGCVLTKFVEYYMNTPYINRLSKERANGTGRKTLPLEESRRFPIPLPPLAEQHRIVDKIEELFSDLDEGIASLKKAQQQLKVYRQAVLKWAFEGKLTAQWREEQKREGKLESAETLLEQIKAERERRYQAALAQWQADVKAWEANGKVGKKPSKPKKTSTYPPVINGDEDEFFILPPQWLLIRLGEAIDEPKYGTSKKCSYEHGSKAVLRIPNIGDGIIETKDLKFADFDDSEMVSYSLQEGDLLTIRSNGSVSLVGKCALISAKDKDFLYAGYLIRLKPYTTVIGSKYLLYCLTSPLLRRQIESKAKSTSGVNNINSGELQDLKVPYCSIAEQLQIVEAIESRLSICDSLEATIAENLERAEALRQSILKQAFEGKLVPQDPNDEPASVLLERIQQERAKGKGGLT